MVPKMMNAYLLLVALLPCLALSEPCKYVMQPDTRVGGAYSAKLDGVHSLQACLDFLLANADSHVAVSYNREKRECCAASVDVPLVLEAESGWTLYKLNKADAELITSTTPLQTEETTKNPVATCDGVDINSALSSIQTNYTGSVWLINCTVVDNVALALYEGYDFELSPWSLTWQETKTLCESVGWRLARLVTPSLLEAAEQMLLNHYLNTHNNDAAVGGVYNVQLGTYVWYNTTIPIQIDSTFRYNQCVYGSISDSPGMRLYETSCSWDESRFFCSSV